MSSTLPRLEFRLPIAPKVSFYNRVHFFCAALRRLGPGYADATVRVTVGDYADIDAVKRENRWAENFPLEWHRVPDDLCATHGYFGTSDFRYFLPESSADLIILADADIVLIRPLGDTLNWMLSDEACIAGHMAHASPPVKMLRDTKLLPADLWPYLFREFGIAWPNELSRYSMDLEARFPLAPAYYNLGFVVLNRPALRVFQERLELVRDRLNEILRSEMRCQIACTLISYQSTMRRQNLLATFNAANDERHLAFNDVRLDDIRVIHYLRRTELDREAFLDRESRGRFLRASLSNPVNLLLQSVAREIIDEEWESESSTLKSVQENGRI